MKGIEVTEYEPKRAARPAEAVSRDMLDELESIMAQRESTSRAMGYASGWDDARADAAYVNVLWWALGALSLGAVWVLSTVW